MAWCMHILQQAVGCSCDDVRVLAELLHTMHNAKDRGCFAWYGNQVKCHAVLCKIIELCEDVPAP